MEFEFVVNANTIIGFVGFLTAMGVLIGSIKNYVHQIDKWNGYDKDIKEIKDEQYMQTKVLLAVLDGLHQKGCNGKVTQATEELTDFLNKNSHN